MSLTTAPTVTAAPDATTRTATSLPRTTVVAGLVAAAATAGVGAALHAAGVSFEVGGEMIPVLGFAQMTIVGAVIGGLLLAVLNRRSSSADRQPNRTALPRTTAQSGRRPNIDARSGRGTRPPKTRQGVNSIACWRFARDLIATATST